MTVPRLHVLILQLQYHLTNIYFVKSENEITDTVSKKILDRIASKDSLDSGYSEDIPHVISHNAAAVVFKKNIGSSKPPTNRKMALADPDLEDLDLLISEESARLLYYIHFFYLFIFLFRNSKIFPFFSEFVIKAGKQLESMDYKMKIAEWNYETNITDANKKVYQEKSEAFGELTLEICAEAKKFDLNQIKDYDVKRKLMSLQEVHLPEKKLKKFNNIVTSMKEIYR